MNTEKMNDKDWSMAAGDDLLSSNLKAKDNITDLQPMKQPHPNIIISMI